MVILSFSVFKDAVLSGRKSRSMVPASSKRWTPIYKKYSTCDCCGSPLKRKGGVLLCTDISCVAEMDLKDVQVYWKHQSPTHCEKLFDAVLTNITKRTLGSLTEAECVADGFEVGAIELEGRVARITAKDNCFNWFMHTYKIPPTDVPQFKVYLIEFARIEQPKREIPNCGSYKDGICDGTNAPCTAPDCIACDPDAGVCG